MAFKAANVIPIPLPFVPAPAAGANAALVAPAYPCLEQIGDNWCWVACTAMVEQRWKGSARDQCRIAGDILQINGCCSSPGYAACDKKASVNQITLSLKKARPVVQFSSVQGGEAWLLNQLRLGAVVALWQWNDISAGISFHVVLIVRAEKVGNQHQFIVHDPEQDEPDSMPFSELASARGMGWLRNVWVRA